MSDEIEEIPHSEYEYSPEKKAELYSKLNITEEIVQIEENIDNEIKEEEIKQLCIFIRNYDSDGNLVESPGNAILLFAHHTKLYLSKSVGIPCGNTSFSLIQG